MNISACAPWRSSKTQILTPSSSSSYHSPSLPLASSALPLPLPPPMMEPVIPLLSFHLHLYSLLSRRRSGCDGPTSHGGSSTQRQASVREKGQGVVQPGGRGEAFVMEVEREREIDLC